MEYKNRKDPPAIGTVIASRSCLPGSNAIGVAVLYSGSWALIGSGLAEERSEMKRAAGAGLVEQPKWESR